jgi:hypothetical protein
MTRPICVSVALAIGACRPAESTMTPSAEVQRQAELGSEYIAADDRKGAAAAELARAEAAELEAKARVQAREQSERADGEEVDRYAAVIVEVRELGPDCRVGPERLGQLHGYLRQFVAEPRRDAAIAELERCRSKVAAARRKEHGQAQVEEREAFARAIEQEFDEAHPRAKGRLVAAVKGTTLSVKLREFFEWRPADGQQEVEAWCARTPHFTSIELRGPHGTARCKPAMTPEEHVAAQVRADGLAEPWVPAWSGTFATPVAGEARDDGEELARLRGELNAATQRVQASRAAHAHAAEAAEAAAGRLRGMDGASAVEAERRDVLDRKKYNTMIMASIPVNLGGVVFGFLGLFSLMAWESIHDGTRQFASPGEREAALQRTSRNAIIGYAVGVPLIAAGLTLALVGARRLHRINRVTFSAGGVGFRF